MNCVYSSLGDKQKALYYFNMALPFQRKIGDKHGEASTFNSIGSIYSYFGDKQEALLYHKMSVDILESIGARWYECMGRFNIGYIYAEQEQWSAALKQFTQAVSIARSLKHPDLEMYANGFNQALHQALMSQLSQAGHEEPAAHWATLSEGEQGALVAAVLGG